MRKVFYRGRFLFIPLAAAGFLSLISFAVMQLWNNLLPAILHVGVITFWQAMGLFILCKLLFGFGKGGPGAGRWKRGRMAEKFRNMSAEDKEKFRARMGKHMCNWDDKHHDHGTFFTGKSTDETAAGSTAR